MRRRGHYENTYYDGRNYGSYSKEQNKWYSSDKSLGDLRNNKRFMAKNKVKSLGDGFYSYEPITYSENRYINDGLDFTPSVWGLVLAVIFFLGLAFLFKGLSDESSIFDTGLSLADVVCNFGRRFNDVLHGTLISVKPDIPERYKDLEPYLIDPSKKSTLGMIFNILNFLLQFIWIFVQFIIECLGTIFS